MRGGPDAARAGRPDAGEVTGRRSVRAGGGAGGGGGVASGRVVAVDLSITVLSDFGLKQAANTRLGAEKIILDHGFHYAKSVMVPQP